MEFSAFKGGGDTSPYGGQKVQGAGVLRIFTPACGLVHNDRFFEGAAYVGGGVKAPARRGYMRHKGDLFFGVCVFFLQLLFQSGLLGQNEVHFVI